MINHKEQSAELSKPASPAISSPLWRAAIALMAAIEASQAGSEPRAVEEMEHPGLTSSSMSVISLE
jgi:hypothetical protein